jgi:hypothetical protein
MNNEFGKMWKEAVVAHFQVISQNFLRGIPRGISAQSPLGQESNP